jgi:hypothetical protein
MKHISPQLGFNNNVRHKGRVFHIQTEDSGVKHPHVITHLFADGGRILKSTKTSYGEFLGEDDLAKKVRSLMQEQHKAMFIALRGGTFDHLFPDEAPAEAAPPPRPSSPGEESKSDASKAAEPKAAEPKAAEPKADEPKAAEPKADEPKASPTHASAEEPEPAPAAAVAAATADAATGEPSPETSAPQSAPRSAPDSRGDDSPRSSESRPLLSALAAQPQTPLSRSRLTPPPPKRDPSRPADPGSARADAAARAGGASARRVEPFAPTMPGLDAMRPSGISDARPSNRAADAPVSSRPASKRLASVPPRAPLSESLELDLEALERAAEQTNSPVYQQLRDLPPPPATLLRGTTSRQTAYRSLTPQAPQLIKEPVQAPKPSAKPATKPAAAKEIVADRREEKDHRYAHSRPASIFGPTRPQEGSNIFGEDLISEKSLDEVILSYLAEDLDPTAKK